MESMTSRGLLFLLSLGAVPLACSDGGSGSETDVGTDSTSGTTGTTANTTGESTTSAGTTGESSTTGESTTTTGESTTTGDPGEVCDQVAAHVLLCYPDDPSFADDALQYCKDALADNAKYSAGCLAAGVVVQECHSKGACGEPSSCSAEIKEETIACSPPSGELCTSWGAKYAECYMKPVDQASYYGLFCEGAIWNGKNDHGMECGAALEEFYACLAALDCPTFLSDTRCSPEQDNVFAKCPL